jgi:hypothetical protein
VANPSFDHGLTPAVAWTGQTVVEVHQSETNFNLFYHVGTIQSNNQIDWGPTRGPYDHGLTPAVAVAGQTVVEVHQSETNFNLFYHVGTIQSNNQIDWGPTRGPYDQGVAPVVAVAGPVAGQKVIEVHKSQNNDKFFYRVGTIQSDKKINWS